MFEARENVTEGAVERVEEGRVGSGCVDVPDMIGVLVRMWCPYVSEQLKLTKDISLDWQLGRPSERVR